MGGPRRPVKVKKSKIESLRQETREKAPRKAASRSQEDIEATYSKFDSAMHSEEVRLLPIKYERVTR